MKTFAAVIMSSVIATSAIAEDLFFKSNSNEWSILGNKESNRQNAACFTTKGWNDGSIFRLVSDLNDGETYIMINIIY